MTNGTEMPTRETDFFQKTFDHKNRLASIILRTSHQAHIYNECDIEATGGDSVDLRKEIVVVFVFIADCLKYLPLSNIIL